MTREARYVEKKRRQSDDNNNESPGSNRERQDQMTAPETRGNKWPMKCLPQFWRLIDEQISNSSAAIISLEKSLIIGCLSLPFPSPHFALSSRNWERTKRKWLIEWVLAKRLARQTNISDYLGAQHLNYKIAWAISSLEPYQVSWRDDDDEVDDDCGLVSQHFA